MNSKTLFYILKRILLAILTVWIVVTITFFVSRAVPGGPFVGEKATTPAVQAAMEAKYGMDKPLLEQYWTYLKDIITKFDFGPSLKQRGRNVVDIIADGMKTSIKLGGIAAGIALVLGVVLGSVAALRRNSIVDKVIMVISTAFISLPSFIMGSLLLVLFALKLGILPANGSTPAGLILPIFTLSLSPMANIIRLTRSSMLDVLGQDYIRTAKAKGAPNRVVIRHHALRNGLIPVITQIGVSFAGTIGGAVVTENIFTIPGVGTLLLGAVKSRNVPVVLGTIIFVTVIVGVINLLVDLLCAVIDPRIDLAS